MRNKKYIIIIGASSMNTGSLSMMFSTVYEIKKRFLHINIEPVVLSNYEYKKIQNDKEEKRDYAFEVLPNYMLDYAPIPYCIVKSMTNLLGVGTKSGRNAVLADRFKEVIENAVACIDISGYSLHSDMRHQMNSVKYCIMIATCKRMHIPMWLFPQSFGPFQYRKTINLFIQHMLRKYLPYPIQIFCRENEGMENLKPYHLTNVMRGYDTVLISRTPDVETIYKEGHKSKLITVKNNGKMRVAIIPSGIVYNRNGKEKTAKMYGEIFKRMLWIGDIYVISHSVLDVPVCQELKKIYGSLNINWIIDDFDPIEIEKLLAQFDMCISSRFHGALHCYKNGVPCVVFGWASKYRELMQLFGQEKYLLDIREEYDDNALIDGVNLMIMNIEKEKERIRQGIDNVENVYDIFEEQLRTCME